METTNWERAVVEGGMEVRMWEDTEEEELWEDRRSGEAWLLDIPHKQGGMKGGGGEYDDYIGHDSLLEIAIFGPSYQLCKSYSEGTVLMILTCWFVFVSRRC